MSCLTLDQVTEHIVGDAGAEAAHRFALDMQRLIKHQGDGVMKLRAGGAERLGYWVQIGAMQEGGFEPCL